VSTRRIDYYDDPQAPKANSLVPSVNVVVTNEVGDVLLIRRTDNGSWALPGGAVDLGESVAQAAVRETREETGIDCTITGVVRIYSVAGPASGDRGEGDRTCHKSTATRFRRLPKASPSYWCLDPRWTRNLRPDAAKLQVARNGAFLVLAHRQAGSLD